MVNLFRKYQQGLMIIVTILVIIAFAWLYNGTRFEKIGAGVVAKIYNRNLLQADVDRIARKFSLSYQLGLVDLAQDLGGGRTQSESLENFVWNSLVLQHEAERLQIEPTDDEVFASLKTLPAFQTNGAFDPQKYATILQDALAPRGFTQEQLELMVREDLRLKIKALIGSTVEISPAEFRALHTQQNQKMEISVVRFNLADFSAAIQVTDENLKKAFDQRKDTLKSDEKRKIKYVNFALPDAEKALKGKERLEALQKLANNADEFVQAALAKDAKFDEIAARYKVKVNETGEFAQPQPDPALAKIPGAVEAAFNLNQGDASADIVRTEEGFYILHLESITPSRLLTFDEAKQKLTGQLRNERAHEAMSLKAAEIRNKIDADVRAGKPCLRHKNAGVKVEAFPPSSLAEPNLDKPDGREIVGKAIEMNDGQLSDFVSTQDGGLLVHLDKRAPIDEAKFEKEKTAQSEDYARGRREAAFREWLRLQRGRENPFRVNPVMPAPEVEELFDDANGDLALGELESAVQKYRRCVELDADFFDGWHALGMALMKIGDIPRRSRREKSVELKPNDQLGWSSLSLFYVRNNQIAEAEAAGAKAKVLSWGGKIKKE